MNIKSSVGSRIREIRTGKGIGLRQFELEIGISRSDLSNIERGKRNVTVDTIEKIAKALDCDVRVLISPKK